jgi:hypothetical protein
MQVLDKYRLELHWDFVSYSRDDVIVLKGAYFGGPVLKDAVQLQEEDQLILDMTDQHLILPPMADFYQAVLSWKGVEYRGDKIFLKDAHIKGKYINSLETLRNKDWILIDCKEHDLKKVLKNKRGKKLGPGVYQKIYTHSLVYWAKIMNAGGAEKY